MSISSRGINLAKTAGFCMGVKRAVDLALDVARSRQGRRIYTYGPLIHNPQTVQLLMSKGIEPLSQVPRLNDEEALIIIRAHGVSPQEMEELKEKGYEVIDATCPKVSHVQAIISKHRRQGCTILIAGDPEHPEVKGLAGYAENEATVLTDEAEVDLLPTLEKICLVAQTTQDVKHYQTIADRLKKRFPQTVVYNTICQSTELRQREIGKLASETEALVIVGGKNSANSRRLAEIARLSGKPSFHIETADDLDEKTISRCGSIGVSAGASTPNWIIDEVLEKISTGKGRSGKGIFNLHNLLRLWFFAVRTDLYAACGAACLSYCAAVVQQLNVEPLNLLTASFYVYAIHILNRYISSRTTPVTGSFRETLFLKSKKAYLRTALLALAFALAISLISGVDSFLLLFSLSLFGAVYYVRVLPSRWRFRSLRDIPGSKNIVIALAWSVVVTVVPQVNEDRLFTPGLISIFIFTFLIVFSRTALADIWNLQSDRLLGRETLPVMIGSSAARKLIRASAFLMLLILASCVYLGFLSPPAIFLVFCVFYLWICLELCGREARFSGLVLEGILETNYIIAGVAAFGGNLFFNWPNTF